MYFPADLWLRAFLLTVLVEVPLAAYLLRRFGPSRPRLLLLLLFANLASHPAVWFIFTQPFLVGTWEYLLVAEAWAVAVEALFYWTALPGLPARRAIAVSLAANAASVLAGQLVTAVWPTLLT